MTFSAQENIPPSVTNYHKRRPYHYQGSLDETDPHLNCIDFHSTTSQSHDFYRGDLQHRSLSNLNSHRQAKQKSPTDLYNTTFPQADGGSLHQVCPEYGAQNTSFSEQESQQGVVVRTHDHRGSAQRHAHQARNSHNSFYNYDYNLRKDPRYRSSDHVRCRNQSLSPTRRRKASSEFEFKTRERVSRYDQLNSNSAHYVSQQNSSNNLSSNRDFNVSFGTQIVRHPKNVSNSTDRLNSTIHISSPGSNSNANKLNNIRAEVDSQNVVRRSKSTDAINQRLLHLSYPQALTHSKQDEKQFSPVDSSIHAFHEQNQLPDTFKDKSDGCDKLVVIKDYMKSFEQAINVRKGDYVLVDPRKIQKDWVWCWSIRLQKQGFVPKSCVSPPFSTAL